MLQGGTASGLGVERALNVLKHCKGLVIGIPSRHSIPGTAGDLLESLNRRQAGQRMSRAARARGARLGTASHRSLWPVHPDPLFIR